MHLFWISLFCSLWNKVDSTSHLLRRREKGLWAILLSATRRQSAVEHHSVDAIKSIFVWIKQNKYQMFLHPRLSLYIYVHVWQLQQMTSYNVTVTSYSVLLLSDEGEGPSLERSWEILMASSIADNNPSPPSPRRAGPKHSGRRMRSLTTTLAFSSTLSPNNQTRAETIRTNILQADGRLVDRTELLTIAEDGKT